MTRIAKSGLYALALALATALPAVAQVKINGAGATFPNIIYQDWILTYNKAHPDVQLNYQSIGSGGGIRQFSDGTIEFGGTDAPMSDSAMAAIKNNVIHIPTVLGAVVLTYNMAEVKEPLRFTPEVIGDIFLGRITKWNDPRIAAANPGVNIPAADIVVAHRSDGSGTSFIFTDYLSKVSPEWKGKVGKGTSVNWPVGLGGKGNEGVSATVTQTPGAIGYVELAYAITNHLPVAVVKNKSGNWVTPTLAAVTEALSGALASMGSNTDFRVSITNSESKTAYPICSMTYLLVHRDYDDGLTARELLKFIWWGETEGQSRAEPLGYAPLPTTLRPVIEARLRTVKGGGKVAWNN